MHKKHVSPVVLISIFLFSAFTVLACLFPYTGDDWYWGSEIGWKHLADFFDGYNGRYLGNLLVLLLTRSKLLDAVFMAASYTCCCWMCFAYSRERPAEGYLLAAVLFFLMPRSVWGQAVVWTSGYVNYVPSALISAGYLLLVRNITDTEPPVYGKRMFMGTFLMGICGALFMENITLFNICLAVAVMGYTWIKFRRWYGAHAGFFAGSVLGAVIMFTNSVYSQIAGEADEYRQMANSVSDRAVMMVKHAKQLLDYMIFENLLFCFVITLLLVLLVFADCRKTGRKYWKAAVLGLHVCSLAAAFLAHRYAYLLYAEPSEGIMGVDICMILVALIYVVTMGAELYLCVPRERRFRMLMPLYCIPVAFAPLLLVDPIGPRNAFFGYLLLMIATADLFSYLLQSVALTAKLRKGVCGALCAVLLVLCAFYGKIFLPIHMWDVRRNEFAVFQSEQGADPIYVCRLPNVDYLHNATPDVENLIHDYGYFHGLNRDAAIEVVGSEVLASMIAETMP